jgi:hypothetical protein
MSRTAARVGLAAAGAAVVLAFTAGPSLASAGHKTPAYHWHGYSQAALGDQHAYSEADEANTDAPSGSRAAAGNSFSGVVCDSDDAAAPGGDEHSSNGRRTTSDSSELLSQEGVRLFGSSCEASAVQDNTSEASAETSLLTVDAVGLTVLGSSARSQTTSGRTSSSAEFTAVSVLDHDVLTCSSESTRTNEGTTSSESLAVDGQVVGDDCPFADAGVDGDVEQPSDEG